MEESICVDKGL
jgi:hypothetical protein